MLKQELEALKLRTKEREAASLDPQPSPQAAVGHIQNPPSHTTEHQKEEGLGLTELQQIQSNRAELLETGIYTENDELICELDARIRQLSCKQ